MKTFKAIENEKFNIKDFTGDMRKRVDMLIVSYEDDKGFEYRKSFTFKVGTINTKSLIPMTI
jgi:hypothetical protein